MSTHSIYHIQNQQQWISFSKGLKLEQVRNSRGKGAISVRANEGLMNMALSVSKMLKLLGNDKGKCLNHTGLNTSG